MNITRPFPFRMLPGYALAACLVIAPAHAAEVVVGENVVNPLRASVAQQDAVISQLNAGGVHVIRYGRYQLRIKDSGLCREESGRYR